MRVKNFVKILSINISILSFCLISPLSFAQQGQYLFVRVQHSDKCLHVPLDFSNGVPVTQWKCIPQNNVQWEQINSSLPGYFKLKNKATGKCIQVNGSSKANNTTISQWNCIEQDNLLWQVSGTDNNFVYIVNKATGGCLHVNNFSIDNDSRISQWKCIDQPNLKWKLQPIK
jgi:hypothetical protein